ncbi:LPXTG-site transpeptidase (sortase) family protein [Marinococcus luteus]|uniref:LPXTG-site transpeptidase (Sortase) family protein n=1 Tax=Marinococcus luteus TaxID=1122204 RepID=A0A1H2QRB3_9BACI|nr:class F sortase [Marinococcus luteus]SDW09635.1 LPXTG-site transpeptidase (sortase) family protein [Marinococcus luteus]
MHAAARALLHSILFAFLVLFLSGSSEEFTEAETAYSEASIEGAEASEVGERTETETQTASSTQSISPASIRISSIGLEAAVDDMGYTESGGMEVPDNGEDTGWFSPGFKPGQQGNAVIAGHVNDRSGPAVFYHLDKLRQGDLIEVIDESGESITFEMESAESYPYDDAPIQQIFGASSERSLQLITCTGEFDDEAGTHRERLVVTASVVEE